MVVPNVAVSLTTPSTSRNREERTLVFTDIVESTAMKRTLGDAVALVHFEEHDAAVRGLLAEYPGARELGVAGDSFTLSFSNAADALMYSLRLHAALEPIGKDSGVSMRVRIGIHSGELLVDENASSGRAIGGIVLDLCARIMSLADGGQTLLSRMAFDEARRALREPQMSWVETLEWLNHGLYQMKGADEPLEVCEVGIPGAAPLKAPAHADKARRISTPDGELVLGWRPAVGREVPGTSWKLERALGEGGFGEVWLAWHTVLKQRRVFKFCFREDRVRSLKREITLFRVLRENAGHHPNIVDVHDVYLNEPPYYVAMDFVEGNALTQWAESMGGIANVPMETRVEIVAQVADALQAAHSAGVLHRDVKPGNILIAGSVGDPKVKLSDFGIGQVMSLDVLSGVTAQGLTQTLMGSSNGSGTQMYLAPEVVRGQPSSPQSDLFALGVVLYQAVIGDFTRPLTTDWEEMIHDGLLKQDLRQCFAGDPARRFPSAERFAESLRTLPQRRSMAEARNAEVAAAERRAFRAGVMRTAFGAAAIIVLVAVLALVAWSQANRAKQSAEVAGKAKGQASFLLERERHQRAEALLNEGKTSSALAYLASVVRENPSQTAVSELLVNTLLQRPLAWPATPPLPHEAVVNDLAMTKDGKSLLVTTAKSTRMWNLETARERFAALPLGGTRLVFSPDGTRAVVAGSTASLIDLATFKVVHKFELQADGPRDGMCDAAYRPQGDAVAVLNAGDELALWDPRTGSRLGDSLRTGDPLARVLFSPDGNSIVASDVQGRVWVWDFATREVRWKAKLPARVNALAWGAAGTRIAAGATDGTFQILRADTGEPVGDGLKAGGEITDANFAPDGVRVCASSLDSGIYVYFAESGRRDWEVYERYKQWQAEFTPDGSMIVTRSSEGLIRFIGLLTRRTALEPIQGTAFPHVVRVSPDGGWVATGGEDGQAQVWRVEKQKAMPLEVNHRATVRGAAFQSNGQQLITAGEDGRLRLWDFPAATNTVVAQMLNPVSRIEATEGAVLILVGARKEGDGMCWLMARRGDGTWAPPKRMMRARQMRFSSDGSHFLIVRVDGLVQLFATATGEPVSAPVGRSVTAAAIGRGGLDLLWVEGEARIRRLDVKSGAITDTPIVTKSTVSGLFVSPDGTWLASTARDVAAVWCLNPDAAPPKYLSQGNAVTSLEFSADNHLAIVTCQHRAAHVWKLPEGVRLPDSLSTGNDLVRDARFLPGDSRRVWTLDTQAVRYWDAVLGVPLSDPLLDHADAREIAATGDGRRLAIVSGNSPEVLIVETPAVTAPAPEWLADWAEAAGGFALGESGTPVPLSFEARNTWRRNAAHQAGDDVYRRALAWWLAKPDTRPLSPCCDVPPGLAPRLVERQYPTRSPDATAAQIDLTPCFSYLLEEDGESGTTGNTLQELAPGLYQWDGLTFDVRGVVQLGLDGINLAGYPHKYSGVKVAQRCKAVHVVGAAKNVSAKPGQELFRLVIHYADGTTAEVPMRNGIELGDWWPFVTETDDRLVWKGANPLSRQQNREIGLYRMQWANPKPELTIDTIDIIAANRGGAAFIVAVTAEP